MTGGASSWVGPHTLGFVLVAIPVLLVPGPDLLLVVRSTALQGRAVGTVTAVGSCTGLPVHATATLLGLTALLAASSEAFTLLKIVGAGYLAYLGVQSIRAARTRGRAHDSDPAADRPHQAEPRQVRRAFKRGLLTNALNPKVAVFFLALLPQFVTPAASSTPQTALLAAIFVMMSTVWLGTVVLAAGAARRALSSPRVRRRLDAISGVALLGLAGRLALTRP